MTSDDWFDIEQDQGAAAAGKDAENMVPAASGDCSPRLDNRRPPRPFNADQLDQQQVVICHFHTTTSYNCYYY